MQSAGPFCLASYHIAPRQAIAHSSDLIPDNRILRQLFRDFNNVALHPTARDEMKRGGSLLRPISIRVPCAPLAAR